MTRHYRTNTDISDATVTKYDDATARALRLELERIAKKIERRSGNQHYKRAWKIAVRIIRAAKPD